MSGNIIDLSNSSVCVCVCACVSECACVYVHACVYACMCVCTVEKEMPTSATSSILVPPAGEAIKIGPPADLREERYGVGESKEKVRKRVGERDERRRKERSRRKGGEKMNEKRWRREGEGKEERSE